MGPVMALLKLTLMMCLDQISFWPNIFMTCNIWAHSIIRYLQILKIIMELFRFKFSDQDSASILLCKKILCMQNFDS